MKLLLCIAVHVLLLVNVFSVPLSRNKRQTEDHPAVVEINNTPVCVVNRSVYRDGELLRFKDPCEICRCRPPGFACSYIRCIKQDPALLQPNCKLVEDKGQCCPRYQCQDENPATEKELDNRNDLVLPTEAAALSQDLDGKKPEELVPPESSEPPKGKSDENAVTERSDELFTGRSEDVTGKSEELFTGKSADLEVATGKGDDFGVVTAEPEGKSDELTPKSADLTLLTEEPKKEVYSATEKEGRLSDESTEKLVEGRAEEESTEKVLERKRRDTHDDATERSAPEEDDEATGKSVDLTPKSVPEEDDLTPKSVDDDNLTPKSSDDDVTPKSGDEEESTSGILNRKRREATEDVKEAEKDSSEAPLDGKFGEEKEATTLSS